MKLSKVLVRFYKSFNYDYEAKASGRKARPWELIDAQFYPFVEVALDEDVTAVVGANESGKSQLLSAIHLLLTGDGHLIRDFCRYSKLFSVEEDQLRFPEVGGIFDVSTEESTTLSSAGIPLSSKTTLQYLRRKPDKIDAVDSAGEVHRLDEGQLATLQALLPHPWIPRVRVALADSVPIAGLVPTPEVKLTRTERTKVIKELSKAVDAQSLATQAAALFSLSRPASRTTSADEQLARTLLLDVARVSPSIFAELQLAITEEREGLVNGLIQQINSSLAKHLNLARWWTQDPDFILQVSPREHELVFTVRDKTGTDYSTGERSNGLVHFLGYLIQFQAHQRTAGRDEILLMDEPDAYLSASGQQDLLRLIDHYSRPNDSIRRSQAVYVTHSPFLVNRNAGHRLRVLEKGIGDEGTRVVKDVTRNRHEPLRSSIGVYVAETAFIGGANLFVEGISDQVLLAGTAAYLQRSNAGTSQRLDLNNVTLVNCGSAGSVPYMLYIARGQDEIKPPCVVLLDSDDAGEKARAAIKRGGIYKTPLVDRNNVIMLGEWAAGVELRTAEYVTVREIEDLIPEAVVIRAARSYARNFLGKSDRDIGVLKPATLKTAVRDHDGSMMDGAKAMFAGAFSTSLDKLGFAKEIIRHIDTQTTGRRDTGVADLIHNFTELQTALVERLRQTTDEELRSRRNRGLRHIIKDFVRDYESAATRDAGALVLHAIESLSDESEAGDALRVAVGTMRRDFELNRNPSEYISGFDGFLIRLEALQYADRLATQAKAGAAPEVTMQ
ncbi:AAA family ATPase [Clavibacter michiganensis]|nr:AAA family ATPase [Clavibacter michiganensis]